MKRAEINKIEDGQAVEETNRFRSWFNRRFSSTEKSPAIGQQKTHKSKQGGKSFQDKDHLRKKKTLVAKEIS